MVSNHRSTLPSQAGWYFIPLLHPLLFLCLLKRTNFSFTLLCSLLPHPVVCWFSPAWFYYTPNSGFQLHLHSLCPILVISNFPPNRSDKVAPSPLQDLLIHPYKRSFHHGPTEGKLWWTGTIFELLPPSPSPYGRNLTPPLNTARLLALPHLEDSQM